MNLVGITYNYVIQLNEKDKFYVTDTTELSRTLQTHSPVSWTLHKLYNKL